MRGGYIEMSPPDELLCRLHPNFDFGENLLVKTNMRQYLELLCGKTKRL